MIRGPRFSEEQLARHAHALADSHLTLRKATPVVSLLNRMRENVRVLAANYDAVMAGNPTEEPISPAAEWFVDNFHAIERQAQLVRRDLPQSYFRLLPKLGPGFLEGHPRMFGIMWAYVAHTDSAFDPDQLARYIQAYSSRSPLELGELWAAAINLRILLVENARRISTGIVTAGRERIRANQLADQLLGIATTNQPPLSLDQAFPGWRTHEPTLPFAVQLMRRLSEGPAAEAVTWIHQKLADRGLDPEAAVQLELAKQSRATFTMRNIVVSLRRLDDVDWEAWLETVSAVERELRRTPGYADQDFATRNLHRSQIERLARGSDQDELTITRRAARFAAEGMDEVGQHVGYWLLDRGAPLLEDAIGYRPRPRERLIAAVQRAGVGGYVAAVVFATLALTALATWSITTAWAGLAPWPSLLLGVLLALPISEFVVARLGTRLTRLIPSYPMPELRLDEGVPEEYRTLVVVPTMITSKDAVRETLETLETHFLGNDTGEIYFAAATDWGDSQTQLTQADLDLLEEVRSGVGELNASYGERFLLFHRERRWNEREGVWMGWERKRGKLEELNRVLRGDATTSITTIEGRIPGPFRYVITLDADTKLPRTAAKRLVGKIAHPLNAAHFASDDPKAAVIRGYTILQPRVTPSLPADEETSSFQLLYSTRQGFDSYTFAVADLYQDLFDEGSFAGKGIYELEPLERALAGEIPENAVLSHDLLEGNYSRSGYVSDVEVVEEHPTSYGVHLSRVHRWTRGDWQLLPWIAGRRSRRMSGLGRWKMVDNLRRSLAPILGVISILVGAFLLQTGPLGAWVGVVAATVVLPQLLPALRSLLGMRRGFTVRSQVRAVTRDISQGLSVGLLDFTFLAHTAAAMVDAIARTLWRLGISRTNLLEWTTAAAAGRSAKGGLPWFARSMAPGLIPPAVLGIATILNPDLSGATLVPLVLWMLAPVAAWLISRPVEKVERSASRETGAQLRAIARRTWRYFEVFVGPESSDLPPDNFQEDPADRVAHRTSPTNIGMYYLSAVAARDLGWIGWADLTDRLFATIRTQISLDHYRGHLFNWYDTATTRPLNPRYISSVDSGNLAGHLIALANACTELATHNPISDDVRPGVLDTLTCAAESGGGAAPDLAGLRQAVAAVPVGAGRDAEQAAWEEVLAVVVGMEERAPAGSDVRDWLVAVAGTVRSRLRDLRLTEGEREAARTRLRWVEAEARREVEAMDFRLVFDDERELLSVGFNPDTEELDAATYDLLASECRLASFVGIAKGDLRTKHWGRLGRGLTAVEGRATLLSWSGSMFEYLMPALVMRSPAGGLLATTMERVVARQREYGEELGIPWGVSESGFNARDRELNYQYSPFGVPGLGIVRGLADNVVIAPYATGLAAQLDPEAALENYRALEEFGARGRYGYYEAVDFTPERLRRGERCAVVKNYMAHHSGMTIVAIHNVLTGGTMREWFHCEPMVRAAELLLHEAEPRVAPVVHARTDELDPARERKVRAVTPTTDRRFVGAALDRRTIGALSNGRLTLTATPVGGTHVRWNGVALTRWHPDLTTDSSGVALFIRDRASGAFHIPTEYPLFEGGATTTALFAEDSILFHRTENRVTTALEHHISPEADVWVQEVTVRNQGPATVDLEVTSAAELALARPGDDDAHPAFSKMFVRTEFRDGVLLATRRQRSSSDPEVWVAQFVTAAEEPGIVGPDPDAGVGVETDGRAFIGRGRSLRNPAQVIGRLEPSGTTGYVMEPVLSLTVPLAVPAAGRGGFHLWTAVAASEEDVLRLVDQHRSAGAFERLKALAFTTAQGQLRHLGITPNEAAMFQSLAGVVLYPDPAMRASAEVLESAGSQADLWALGISGDLPIVVVRIDDEEDIDLVRQAVRAFEYLRLHRIAADLVLLAERGGYLAGLQRRLEELAGSIQPRTGNPDSTGHVFVVRRDLAPVAALDALFGAAAVVLVAKRGDLSDQLVLSAAAERPNGPLRRPPVPAEVPEVSGEVALPSGYGGFVDGGREYAIATSARHHTPAPWTNVVANAEFGFHATAEGAGYTWWGNSRDNQLTPWRNQPIESPVSEVLYVQDLRSGTAASLGSRAVPGGEHETRHGFGYTEHSVKFGALEVSQTMFVPLEGAVKAAIVRVVNTSPVARAVRLTWYAEPVLGQSQTAASRHLITSVDERTGALVVRNPWSPSLPGQAAFVDMEGRQGSWTGDRAEFLGRHGSVAAPAAIRRKAAGARGSAGAAGGGAGATRGPGGSAPAGSSAAARGPASGVRGEPTGSVTGNLAAPLSGRVGAGMDPCLAMARDVEVGPGETAEVVITFGAAAAADEVAGLVDAHRATDWNAELEAVRQHWDRILGMVQVRTPDPAFDVLMNGWLLYQTIACRITARSGYYQASGAYGFRDQLQDSMTSVLVDPAVARAHLLIAAGRQFREGDVQHWWLPATGAGIRTRITDDVVWLSYVTAHYLRVTGDFSVLEEWVPFLEGDELAEGEHERYFQPETSEEGATLYEHCLLGLRHAMRYGFHGLPLMGTGDWNDGMNRVGEDGRGESVWLGWFLATALQEFGEVADQRGDAVVVKELAEERERLLAALEAEGWDGAWYRRGYFDDGTPLGSAGREECRIDAIAQSWAVLSGGARPDRARMAMEAVQRELEEPHVGILKLFTPPFEHSDPDPGYIRAYPPGVRENGGQYTHGALWSVFAWARLGRVDRAHEIFSMLNPVNHARDRAAADVYAVEPYVVAADVYSVAPFEGKGGWTWYTGSAGWMYRAGLEAVLGVRREAGALVVTP
ncbi:MAG: glucoamylase family protein, partial [bacterium]|nr:glucoamylase family protein [bacterium]